MRALGIFAYRREFNAYPLLIAGKGTTRREEPQAEPVRKGANRIRFPPKL